MTEQQGEKVGHRTYVEECELPTIWFQRVGTVIACPTCHTLYVLERNPWPIGYAPKKVWQRFRPGAGES